jgi:hypothetical protein
MNVELLKNQIERRRRLAKQADPFIEKRLINFAADYEARIFELEKGYRPSPGSLLLQQSELTEFVIAAIRALPRIVP